MLTIHLRNASNILKLMTKMYTKTQGSVQGKISVQNLFCFIDVNHSTRVILLYSCCMYKPCYSHISSLLLESQNTLSHICLYIHLLLRQGVVIQKRCSSKSPFTVPQFINQRFISISLFHMMLQNSGMICHWKFELLQHYHASKHNSKPTCSRSLFHLSFSLLPNTDDPLVTTLLWLMIYDSYIMIG